MQIALPIQKWTQRFLQVGCGGLCGNINISLSNANGCIPAVNGEFAVAATNMGHQGSMMDGSWGKDPQKRIDFAYRANHLTALLSKAIISTYYGHPQKYSYFMGCSDGGREALMEAQRYPDDFNGITVGAPAAFFQFQNSFYHGWNVDANKRQDGTSILLQDRLPILHKAILEHCPTLSGVKDGILENPWACHFSEKWIQQCTVNQKDKSNCLTQEEINVVKKLYAGATDNTGDHFVLAGLPLGSELKWPVPQQANQSSMSEIMVLPMLQYILLPQPDLTIQSIKDFPLTIQNFNKVAELAPLYNATNTNLNSFMRHGGKLLIWHGLADDSVSPAFSIAYYRGVVQTLGQQSVDQFIRLFLLPGVGHCGGGEGYDQINLLTPLMEWVEQNQAPHEIIAGKRKEQTTNTILPSMSSPAENQSMIKQAEIQFHGLQKTSNPFAKEPDVFQATRPIYPYPYIAQYKGSGDVNKAENYRPIKSSEFDKLQFSEPAIHYIGPDNQNNYGVKNHQLFIQEK